MDISSYIFCVFFLLLDMFEMRCTYAFGNAHMLTRRGCTHTFVMLSVFIDTCTGIFQ